MNKYWRDRELNHIKRNIRADKKGMAELRKSYRVAIDNINDEIERFYGRYAETVGITIEEATKRVSKLDIKRYEKKAKKYVKEKDFTPTANREMKLYNVTMRVNRLELLKKEIELDLLALGSEEERIMHRQFLESVKREYKHQSAILGKTIDNNQKAIESIINSTFHNARWSDNIWANQNALRSELDKLLHRGIVQGKNPRVLARELREVMASSVYNSERLLRTETARIQTDIFEDSAKQAGVEKYVIIAEPDACNECAALDNGEPIDLKDMEIGYNAVPIHPNCRCSNAMYVERE